MKKKLKLISLLVVICIGLIASDHIDSPAVIGQASDISDLYVFQGEDPNNLVFVATIQGILSPTETENAQFDQNVLIEFNIDTNNDKEEDLVIQAIRRGSTMHFFGPDAPNEKGTENTIITNANTIETVQITPYGSPLITRTTKNGIKYFAGATDDPFYFDIGRYREIITGKATGFNKPGNDTWNGLNVLSIVIEVPKSLLGGNDSINTWVTANRRK